MIRRCLWIAAICLSSCASAGDVEQMAALAEEACSCTDHDCFLEVDARWRKMGEGLLEKYPNETDAPADLVESFVKHSEAKQACRATLDDDRFETHIYKPDSAALPYRLLKPRDYDPSQQYPLVLFLHGAGQRGDDNRKQLGHPMIDFAREDMRDEFPAFVVAPQCPENVQWVDTPWSADSHSMPEQPTKPLRLSLELVDAMQKEFSIDEDRIYVTGLSMGGFGTWDVIQRHPERFAAAVPICGGGDPAHARQIAQIPIWAYHGDNDAVVKVERSRDMIAAIKDSGGTPRYTELPGVGHDSWTAAYTNPDLYTWMFAQARLD
jgi:predicted peptidase